MGASLVYLNEPNKEIEHEKGGNDYLAFAAGSMQGWRLNMVSDHPTFQTGLGLCPKKTALLNNLNFRKTHTSHSLYYLVIKKKLYSEFSTAMVAEKSQSILTGIISRFWEKMLKHRDKRMKRNGWGSPFWKLMTNLELKRARMKWGIWEGNSLQKNLQFWISWVMTRIKKIQASRQMRKWCWTLSAVLAMSSTSTKKRKRFSLQTRVIPGVFWVKLAKLLRWVSITNQSVRLRLTE